jgi:hypothetical protein
LFVETPVAPEDKSDSHEVELESFVAEVREMFGLYPAPLLARYKFLQDPDKFQDPEMEVGHLAELHFGEGSSVAGSVERGSLGNQRVGTEERVEGGGLVLAAERANCLDEFLDPERRNLVAAGIAGAALAADHLGVVGCIAEAQHIFAVVDVAAPAVEGGLA